MRPLPFAVRRSRFDAGLRFVVAPYRVANVAARVKRAADVILPRGRHAGQVGGNILLASVQLVIGIAVVVLGPCRYHGV